MRIFIMQRRMRLGCAPERRDAGIPIACTVKEGGTDE